jgi:hypothetical protein
MMIQTVVPTNGIDIINPVVNPVVLPPPPPVVPPVVPTTLGMSSGGMAIKKKPRQAPPPPQHNEVNLESKLGYSQYVSVCFSAYLMLKNTTLSVTGYLTFK